MTDLTYSRDARLWLAASLAMAAAGCSSTPPDSTTGELGRGHFQYICAGTNDVWCPDGIEAQSFPSAFAVMGSFSLAYYPEDGKALPEVQPGSRSAITKQGDVFTIQMPGYVAVLAQTTFGDVVDLLHLSARPVAQLEIEAGGAPLSMAELGLGERVRLRARPQDAGGVLLAGSLSYAWTSTDETVVRLTSDGASRQVEIEAVGTGSAELQIAVGGHFAQFVVQVSETPPGTGEGTDSSTTASDETTSDATETATDTDSTTGDTTTTDSEPGTTGDSTGTSDDSTGTTGGTSR